MSQENNVIKNVLKQQLFVDQEKGPIKSIQEAIDKAEPNTIIKIASGLYTSNIVIDKPGLRLEPKDKLGEIIVAVYQGPTITINLQADQRCTLVGMKLTHHGKSDEVEETSHAQFLEMDQGLQYFNDLGTQLASSPQEEFVYEIPIDPQMSCAILINSGKLFMEDCQIALGFLTKTFDGIAVGIAINKNAECVINRCDIKGTNSKNMDKRTAGIVCKFGGLLIRESKILNQSYGGILIQGNTQAVRIINCQIVQNKKVGIHIIGAQFTPTIDQCRIENNEGPGIKVGIGNTVKIMGNEIRTNTIGIEVLSADPFICNNRIDKNYSDGIHTKVFEQLRCDGRIKKNQSITGNRENGIHCTGVNNYTNIEQNTFIGYNKKSGIRADYDAKVNIFKNDISKNLGQGIILVESSSAVIERNRINDNLKANIALGGANSVDTLIVENTISRGRCEGIFIIDCGKCWILRNTISENNDGIVCITAVPFINLNIIEKNKSIGIMIMKDSRPDIIENTITENRGIGVFIRDKSNGNIRLNTIEKNEIELVVERRQEKLCNIVSENCVKGDIRIPQNYDCFIQ